MRHTTSASSKYSFLFNIIQNIFFRKSMFAFFRNVRVVIVFLLLVLSLLVSRLLEAIKSRPPFDRAALYYTLVNYHSFLLMRTFLNTEGRFYQEVEDSIIETKRKPRASTSIFCKEKVIIFCLSSFIYVLSNFSNDPD